MLLSRAGGGVDFRTRKRDRGSEASDRGLVENLRKIPNTSFRNCQHYRRSQAPDRVMHVNLCKIWNAKTNTIDELTSKVSKVQCFTMQVGTPVLAARIRQHYCGFAHVGRCGPQTVQSGQKVDGKTRHFRSEGCSFPEREAGSVRGPANTIEEMGHRVAECPKVYVGSGAPVSGMANTTEEARPWIT